MDRLNKNKLFSAFVSIFAFITILTFSQIISYADNVYTDVVVSVPTQVIMSGEQNTSGTYAGKYTGEYTVRVYGDTNNVKSIAVGPLSDTISLNQDGCTAKSATIHQSADALSQADLSGGSNTITGTIVSDDITAGCWHSSFNLVIEETQIYAYYSNLPLAVGDANNLTMENADITYPDRANAMCALKFDDNTGDPIILMFKNSNNTPSFTVNQNLELDLNSKEVNFADRGKITTTKSLNIHDGDLNFQSPTGSVQCISSANSYTNIAINLDSVNLSHVGPDNNDYGTVSSVFITSKANTINVNNCTFTASGYYINGVVGTTTSGTVTVTNTTMNFANAGGNGVSKTGGGNLVVNNLTVTNAGADVYGIGQISSSLIGINAAGTSNVATITDFSYSSTAPVIQNACAIKSTGRTLTINGSNINMANAETDSQNYGIFSNATNTTINSSTQHPVVVTCGDVAIRTSQKTTSTASTVINGGTYSSPYITGIISAGADINDAAFVIANRSTSHTVEGIGLCFGNTAGDVNTSVVNMTNCIVGNAHSGTRNTTGLLGTGITTDNITPRAINILMNTADTTTEFTSNNTLTADYYVAPAEINLFDCTVYGGYDSVFYYHGISVDDQNATTVINLYDDTQVIKYNTTTAYTSSEIRTAQVNFRQARPTYVNDATTYTGGVGIKDLVEFSAYYPDAPLLAHTSDLFYDGYTDSEADTSVYHNNDAAGVHIRNSEELYEYYSTLARAMTDANNLTTENADIAYADRASAVAGLQVNEDNETAKIWLVNDSLSTPALTSNSKLTLNLGDHTASFTNTANLTANNDLTIKNGDLSFSNCKGIYGDSSHTDTNISVSNVDFTLAGPTTTAFGIDVYASDLTVKNCTFASTSGRVLGASNRNTSGDFKVEDCDITFTGITGGSGFQSNANIFEVSNTDINITSSTATASNLMGINGSNSKNMTVDDVTIVINSTGNDCFAIQLNNTATADSVSYSVTDSSVTLSSSRRALAVYAYGVDHAFVEDVVVNTSTSGGSSYSATGMYFSEVNDAVVSGVDISSIQHANPNSAGLGANTKNSFVVNSTNEHPVVVHGTGWGLQTSAYGTNTINGGVYTSSMHPAYISASANIQNATFTVADFNNCTFSDRPTGFYFGSQHGSFNSAVVTLRNCIIGNSHSGSLGAHDNIATHGLGFKYGNDHIPAKEVNIYDCEIYSGTADTFFYSDINGGIYRATTKVNLYGNTVIHKYNSNSDFTATEIEASQIAWRQAKPTYFVPNSSQPKNWYTAYNSNPGHFIEYTAYRYNGNANSLTSEFIYDNYDEDETDTSVYLNADAVGVHDYRSYVLDISDAQDESVLLTYDGVTKTATISGTGTMQDFTSDSMFEIPERVRNIVINGDVTNIGAHAFDGCTSVESLVIPKSVTTLGVSSFANMTGLRELTTPCSIYPTATTPASDLSFAGTTNIEEVTVTRNSSNSGTMTNYSTRSRQYTPWYLSRANLTSITFEDGFTSLGNYVCYGCSALTEVNIPSGVTGIGTNAFQNTTSLEEISLPNGLTTIGNVAFSGSGIEEIDIPSTVTSIGSSCFKATQLTSITFPSGVHVINSMVCQNCTSLEEVTFLSGINTIDNQAFSGCESLAAITIPKQAGYDVSLGQNAFSGCTGLESVTMPATFTAMDSVFDGCENISYCRLTGSGEMNDYSDSFEGMPWQVSYVDPEDFEMIIDDGVTYIGAYTFTASIFSSIDMPDSVEGIGERAFQYSCLESFDDLSPGITDIPEGLFEYGGLTGALNIPDNIETVEDWAFSDNVSITSVSIPDSITYISETAFSRWDEGAQSQPCAITSITVDSNNATYDSRNNCNAIIETDTNSLIAGCVNTTIPNNVVRIGESAFSGRGITSITIPASVECIDSGAFEYCRSLATVRITKSNTAIDINADAFHGCASLATVYLPGNVNSLGTNALATRLNNNQTTMTVYCETQTVADMITSDVYGSTAITAPTVVVDSSVF